MPQKVTLTRAPLVYPPVSGKLVTDQGPDPIGVIQTYTLAKGRVKEIAAKIAELQKQGAKRLILDLRHCSTGDPEEGVALANLFMDKGLIALHARSEVHSRRHAGRPVESGYEPETGCDRQSRYRRTRGNRRRGAARFQARRCGR